MLLLLLVVRRTPAVEVARLDELVHAVDDAVADDSPIVRLGVVAHQHRLGSQLVRIAVRVLHVLSERLHARLGPLRLHLGLEVEDLHASARIDKAVGEIGIDEVAALRRTKVQRRSVVGDEWRQAAGHRLEHGEAE